MYAKQIAALAGGLALLTFPALSPAADKDDCQYRYRYGYGRYSPVRYYGGYYPGRYYGYGARVHSSPLIGAGFGVGYPRYGYNYGSGNRYGYRYGRHYNPGPRVGNRIGFSSGYPGYSGRPYRYAGFGYPGYLGGGHRRAYSPAATSYRRSYYGGPAFRRGYYPVAGARRGYRSSR